MAPGNALQLPPDFQSGTLVEYGKKQALDPFSTKWFLLIFGEF